MAEMPSEQLLHNALGLVYFLQAVLVGVLGDQVRPNVNGYFLDGDDLGHTPDPTFIFELPIVAAAAVYSTFLGLDHIFLATERGRARHSLWPAFAFANAAMHVTLGVMVGMPDAALLMQLVLTVAAAGWAGTLMDRQRFIRDTQQAMERSDNDAKNIYIDRSPLVLAFVLLFFAWMPTLFCVVGIVSTLKAPVPGLGIMLVVGAFRTIEFATRQWKEFNEQKVEAIDGPHRKLPRAFVIQAAVLFAADAVFVWMTF